MKLATFKIKQIGSVIGILLISFALGILVGSQITRSTQDEGLNNIESETDKPRLLPIYITPIAKDETKEVTDSKNTDSKQKAGTQSEIDTNSVPIDLATLTIEHNGNVIGLDDEKFDVLSSEVPVNQRSFSDQRFIELKVLLDHYSISGKSVSVEDTVGKKISYKWSNISKDNAELVLLTRKTGGFILSEKKQNKIDQSNKLLRDVVRLLVR